MRLGRFLGHPGRFWRVLAVDIKQVIRQLQKLERDRMRAIESGDARQEDACDEMIALIMAAVDAKRVVRA